MTMEDKPVERTDRLQLQDLRNCIREGENVTSAQISENGEYIAFVLEDDSLHFVSIADGRALGRLKLADTVESFKWCKTNANNSVHQASPNRQIAFITKTHTLAYHEVSFDNGTLTTKLLMNHELNYKSVKHLSDLKLCESWFDEDEFQWKSVFWSQYGIFTLKYDEQTHLPIGMTNLLVVENSNSQLLIGCSASLPVVMAANVAGFVYVIDVSCEKILHQCSISVSGNMSFEDVNTITEEQSFTSFATNSNLCKALVVDKHNNIFTCDMLSILKHCKLKIEDNALVVNSTTQNEDKQPYINQNDELIVHVPDGSSRLGDAAWLNDLNYLKHSFMCDVEENPQISLVHSNLYWNYIPVPHWMNDLNVTILLVETTSVLFYLAPSSDPTLSVFDEMKYGGVGLLEFESQQLSFDRFDDHGVLVISHCKSLPHCIMEGRKLYLETFGIPQQNVICHIIQFGGVSKAESLCKYNKWDQFLIPLHILSIGLQHKQLDTVAFFLKSRERAFTRRLKVLLSRPHHSSSTSSLSPALSPPYTNSPDHARRQRSTSSAPVDADELISAIELLLGTLQNSYQKKHKEYFFRSLLSMTHTYVNSLLRDAIEAQRLLSLIDPCNRLMFEDHLINSEFSDSSLLEDMNESINFLSKKVLELRRYFKVPQIAVKENIECSSANEIYNVNDPKEIINDRDQITKMLLEGKIATLQSKLLNTSASGTDFVCNGSWESLQAYVIKFVFELLNKNEFENSVKILNNMGLDTVNILKSIYKKTINPALRDFMFDRLNAQFVCFSENELEDYSYCSDFIDCYNNRSKLPLNVSPWNLDLLSVFEDGPMEIPPVDPNIKCVISLDLIERWDKATRQEILLDFGIEYVLNRDIQIQQSVLWSYLTSHNNKNMLQEWIRGENTLLPKLDGNIITKENTICMKSTRKIIEKGLANYGIFLYSPDEDFPELLTSICRSLSLFTQPHPMLKQMHLSEDERRKRKVDFDREFSRFCIDKELDQFMYSYLDFYELHLDGTSDTKAIVEINTQPSWVRMMSAFREAAEDPTLVYKASLTNAEYAYDMPDANINSMIKAGKPIAALATALLYGDGVFEFQPSDSNMAIDRDLLYSSLLDYPKLRSALCSPNEETRARNPAVSLFDLLHDNTVLDLSRTLGHMPGNTYFSRGEYFDGLPSFSNPELSKKFGVEIRLNWLYFVRLGMGSFAYFYLLKDEPDISKSRKRALYSKARSMSIANFDNLTITASCIIFLGCLGCNTLSLQVDVEVARFVCHFIPKKRNYGLQHCKDFKEQLKSYMTTDSNESYDEYSKLVEEAVDFSIDYMEIDRESYKALYQWRIYSEFCKCHKITPSVDCLVYYSKRSLWLHFIFMMQMHQFQPEEGIQALETGMTNLVLKEHLIATLRNVKSSTPSAGKEERQVSKRRSRKTKPKPTAAKERNVRAQFYSKLGTIGAKPKKTLSPLASPEPVEESKPLSESMSEKSQDKKQRRPSIQIVCQREIFSDNILDILLECERLPCSWRSLLSYSIVMKEPIFAVLAGCYKDSCYIYCICVWLCVVCDEHLFDIIYMDICGTPASTDVDFPAMQRHDWSKEDLGVIVMLLLNHDIVSLRYLHQAFVIFLPECALTTMLQFWINFATLKAFDDCKKDLMTLSYTLSQDYTSFIHLPSDIDIEWTIDMIIKVIKNGIIGCELRYYQWKLLNLLYESSTKSFWQEHDIEVQLLEGVSFAIQRTNSHANMKKLMSTNENTRSQEHSRIIQSLVEEKEFQKAKEVARLFHISIEGVVMQEVEEELNNFQNSVLWDQHSARIAFWESFNQMLIDSGCPGNEFAKYLQELTNKIDAISFEEKSILLTMALDWQQKQRFKTDEEHQISYRFMSNIEQEIWMCKIRMEEEEMKGDGFEPKQTVKQIISKDRSVSISGYKRALQSELLQPELLHDVTLPKMSSKLSNQQEMDAFESLVGKLLNECEVTQARRVAHQFKKSTTDLDIVMSCIFLAEGTFSIDNLNENVKSILAKTPTRHLFSPTSSKLEQSGSFSKSNVASFSSISTSPGAAIVDWVLVEEIQDAIEKLMSRCNMGKNCCHRVLVSFNISQLLNLPYSDVVAEPASAILALVLNTELEQRFVVAKQYVKAYELSSDEACSFVCEYISSWYKIFYLTRRPDPTEYQQFLFSSPPNNDDIQLLFQLVKDTARLGHMFINETSDLFQNSSGDDALSTGVELLICAHSCFTLSCNMEGISEILQIAKRCVETLKCREMFSVMVRLLVGIGRYKEMTYVFEILLQCFHFELLFKQSFERENQLKRAILDFIRRYHPNDTENFKLITLHFKMLSEAAKELEETGQDQIKTIRPRLKAPYSSELEMGLKAIADTFSYAAEYYKEEQRHRKAGRCVRLGQLALLQKRLLPTGVIVLGLDKSEVKTFLGKHRGFAEALLVADAYELMSGFSWADALYNIFIKADDHQYFNEFLSFLTVTASLAAEIGSRYKSERHSSQEALNMKKLLSKVKELRVRYRLAHDLGFNELASEIANEPHLKDTMFLGM